MIKLNKNSIKTAVVFILGGIIFSSATYAVTYNFASGDVEHTKADGTKTNVNAAINDLYSKAAAGDAAKDQILSGKKALSKGTLLTGTMANYSSSTGQSCTIANTSNILYVKPSNTGYYTSSSSFNTNINYNPNKTVSVSASTAAATANGNTTATTINLDKDRKVTIPAGYYSSATTVQNVAVSSTPVEITNNRKLLWLQHPANPYTYSWTATKDFSFINVVVLNRDGSPNAMHHASFTSSGGQKGIINIALNGSTSDHYDAFDSYITDVKKGETITVYFQYDGDIPWLGIYVYAF